ncbi:MAG: terminase small subunit [Proteobacteria bacterium]|nr:terminase small subunit [Cystobacterineae bacterium]MCL2258678.1 terminase small subunit [Cystobacterineae bacterium]MCL2314930.1 terminase small subunit [Pseudomonadota bacterium]MCL2626175.1 terminase small subunit [Cystobacterineae bacterium]
MRQKQEIEQCRKFLFIRHVLEGKSAARAARLAGYSLKGAKVQGHRLMKDKDVRAAIEEGRKQAPPLKLAESQESESSTSTKAPQLLAAMGIGEIRMLLDAIARGIAREEVPMPKGGTLVVRPPDTRTRLKALELNAKILGLLDKDKDSWSSVPPIVI